MGEFKDGVKLRAVVGRRVVPGFRAEYAWVKRAVAVGEIARFYVEVVVTGEDSWPHTVAAVRQALGGVKLAAGGRFELDVPVELIGTEKVAKVLAATSDLEQPDRVKPFVPRKSAKTEPVKPEPKAVEDVKSDDVKE